MFVDLFHASNKLRHDLIANAKQLALRQDVNVILLVRRLN